MSAVIIQMGHVSAYMCVCVCARSEKQLVKTRDCHFQKTDIFLSENGQELLSLALLPKKKKKKKARGGERCEKRPRFL